MFDVPEYEERHDRDRRHDGQKKRASKRIFRRARALLKTPLWPEIKNFVNYDIYKIVLPLNYSEPLSLLQRLAEDFEYSKILNKAALLEDSLEQCAYVAAFVVSGYSSTYERIARPFNPVLGETYELDTTKTNGSSGFRYLAEQVSNRPPTTAIYVEGENWRCHTTFRMESKFPGKYIEISPTGTTFLEFHTGNKYSWNKPKTVIHDIVHGRPFVDNHGSVEVKNQEKDEFCSLNFLPYDFTDRNTHKKVVGCVTNENGDVRLIVEGKWDEGIRISYVKNSTDDNGMVSLEKNVYKTIWKREPLPPDADAFYNMPTFARSLNRFSEKVAPTDSRRRLDIRACEEGLFEKANELRMKMENIRRTQVSYRNPSSLTQFQARAFPSTINEMTPDNLPYFPIWFSKVNTPDTDDYEYNGEYWECKSRNGWFVCPKIYTDEIYEYEY